MAGVIRVTPAPGPTPRKKDTMATPGSNNMESGGANVMPGMRNSTSTYFEKANSVNPKNQSAMETFAVTNDDPAGLSASLETDVEGDNITSTYYEHIQPGANKMADRGTPAQIPDPNVVNRGYRNNDTPLPTVTKDVSASRQSWH